jgi:acyl-CoA thioester hydrolase
MIAMPTVEQLADLPRYLRKTIPPDYKDAMGHMNIRWYMALYDEAEWDFFTAFGMDNDYYQARHSGGFALQQFVRYLAEVHIGDTVAVQMRMLARSAKRIHYMNFMVNETQNVLASTMEVLATHADLNARRSSAFPPDIAAQIDEMIAQHRALTWDAPLCGAINV